MSVCVEKTEEWITYLTFPLIPHPFLFGVLSLLFLMWVRLSFVISFPIAERSLRKFFNIPAGELDVWKRQAAYIYILKVRLAFSADEKFNFTYCLIPINNISGLGNKPLIY